MKINWKVFCSDMFMVIVIILFVGGILFLHNEHSLQQIDQQRYEIRSELCKDYFTHLNDTEYIVLSEPEFVVRNSGEYICKIKLGKNCTGFIRKSQDKTFAINVCQEVAYAGLNTGIYKGD